MKNEIRFDIIFDLIKKKWKVGLITAFITAVVSAFLILCVPRSYSVEVKLIPEYTTAQNPSFGSLGDAASMFGINIGNTTTSDAITPEFYPDLMKTTGFVINLIDVYVETKDGSFKGVYGEYVQKELKDPWWTNAIKAVTELVKWEEEDLDVAEDFQLNPFMLSRKERRLLDEISSTIECSIDTKTDVITIRTTTQDPLVAAMLAEKLKIQLQDAITKYRTEKTRNDLESVTALCDEARDSFVKAQEAYADYIDKHKNVFLQVRKNEEEMLLAEKQLAFNMYNSLSQQKLMCMAKLQERTPAFTVLQDASVPVIPSAPRRTVFVLTMMLVSMFVYFLIAILRERKLF